MEPIIKTCPVCGNTYKADPVRLRHGRQTTCSRECSYKLRADGRTNRAQMACSVCGKEFLRTPSQVKSQHEGVYCSRECHYAGRSLGLTRRIVSNPYVLVAEYDHSSASALAWETRRQSGKDRHSEATKERLSQATIRHMSQASEGIQVSKLEDKVAQELTDRGIIYVRQYAIRNPANGQYVAVVDFLLNGRFALEVNGTFWHADPRFFPDGPVYAAQRRTVTRYTAKVAALQALHVPLIEVWEADLEQGFVNAIGDALRGVAI